MLREWKFICIIIFLQEEQAYLQKIDLDTSVVRKPFFIALLKVLFPLNEYISATSSLRTLLNIL